MVLHNLWSGFGLGFVGGLIPELLGLYALRREAPANYPTWIKRWYYWALSIMMMFLGGGVVVIYMASGVTINLILAINIGASAPLLLRSIGSQTPNVDLPTN